ncbi:CoA transferase, partial [Ralstonia pseudosolanacearum]
AYAYGSRPCRTSPWWAKRARPMAHWLRGLGRLDHGLGAADPRYEDIGPWLETAASGFGLLTALRHAGQLSDTPPRWTLPAVPLGTHAAAWPSPR